VFSSEPDWAWFSFRVPEPQCFEMRVVGGRARIYALRVGVSW
jgi:hypothetical protein